MNDASLAPYVVTPDTTIRAAVECINANTKGVALVLDESNRLEGTITDGDIRRAVLAGINLSSPLRKLLADRANSPYPEPITAPEGTPHPDLLHIMNES